jgi:hypothetical protein
MREKFPISEDYDIILNMLSAGKNIINFPKFLIKYRVNKSSNTFTKKNPEYFFGKAREFYQQRVDTGKDDYENLKIPDIVIQVDPDKSDLAIHIIAEFQDNQQRKVRENIIKYIKRYGFNLTFVSYYVLSFLPTKIYAHLRRKL